jgi:choline dehydrogenase-like flavoprotein
MRYDVVVVGGGTAGCVLAARLSESADRSVCLVEAGPDYGPLEGGRWPAEILDARALPTGHDWGPGGEDGRSLGGRVLGGSSAVNACMVVTGSPADYDEWGHGWSYEEVLPYLERAATGLRTARSNTGRPARFQAAFLDAAEASGFPLLPDPNHASAPVGVAPFPANVVDGRRWNAAFAYLDPARDRPNLSIVSETLVDRVALDRARATGVVTADGRQIEADVVLLAAGAYFSPAILARSGVGPEAELHRLGIPIVESLPVGERLLDHCGTDVAWTLSPALQTETDVEACGAGLFEAHAFVKAASAACERGSWDLHLLPWIYAAGAGFQASVIVFLMKPLSTGRIRLRSTDPRETPAVERGFLTCEDDLVPLVEGIGVARAIGAAEPLRELLTAEVSPGAADPEQYVRSTIRNYFHPAGTCPLGTVVDTHGRVFGTEGLYVADASFMPTIPRANTNLTTAAIAERIADGF